MKQDVGLFDAPFFSITPNEAKVVNSLCLWVCEF